MNAFNECKGGKQVKQQSSVLSFYAFKKVSSRHSEFNQNTYDGKKMNGKCSLGIMILDGAF